MPTTPFGNPRIIMYFFARLEHAVAGEFAMHGECGHCRHTAPLDAAAIAGRVSPRMKLRDLERKLRCSDCGRRGGCEIVRTFPDGRPYST